MAEAAADVVFLGKKDVEGEEESGNTSSTSTRDGVSARVLKRRRLTDDELRDDELRDDELRDDELQGDLGDG
ncbi:hypothetical protein BGZ79_006345, partial [Entomortierella chlamydospora]